MTALEIRPEEIGRFDLAAYKARRARLSAPIVKRPGDILFPQRPRIIPTLPPLVARKKREAQTVYLFPIGPCRERLFLDAAAIRRDWLFQPRPVPAKRILASVCARHGVSLEELISARRHARFQPARREAYYRLYVEGKMSFPECGRRMGGRDHTTALYGYRKFKELLDAGKVSL